MGALALKNDLKQKIAVIGMGITGHSCVKWFVSRGHDVTVFDTRSILQGLDEFGQAFPSVEVVLGTLDVEVLRSFDRVIVSPGISIKDSVFQQLIADEVEIVGDIEVFAQEVAAPVIAITGSNGKSTVTTLVGEIVKKAGVRAGIAGNIGVPALDALEEQFDLYVLELSSFQLDTTRSLKPKVAAVLNVSPDHLDRYDSYDEYVESKESIFHNAEVCVVNRDDARVMQMSVGESVIGFTLGQPGDNDFGLRNINGETVLCEGTRAILATKEMLLSGKHNYANALAALAICKSLNISDEASVSVLRTFGGLEHRTQLIAKKNDICWFNDSKGTNVGATIAAVSGMEGPVILIAGGQSKDQDFSPLSEVVKKRAKAVLLYGEDAAVIEKALGKGIVRLVSDLEQAVELAAQIAEPGDCVLLSPACASFDMFKNYQERGNAFVKYVEEKLGR